MALADIQVEYSRVVFKNGEFDVHGINLDIVTKLLNEGHREDMSQALEQLRESLGDDLELADSANLIGALSGVVKGVPNLVAKVIAYSAGEPDQWEKVKLLSLPVQLDALLAIGKLTFDGEDSVKKFVGSLIELAVAVRKNATPTIQAATDAINGMKD